ncbi:carbonic anhydrase [Actinomadura barringtoniae]|uniref:Carbonic anhydrase n=1 Tax=Actinomadura barringtoniae TaxID=1427535 RepID=A0A939PT91_9ACTN|nr:carbonic anhydrase [Actinomadura barringtoniae]MBO2454654.1 carbonic anhydrase [Actinomadura barringtoniae]
MQSFIDHARSFRARAGTGLHRLAEGQSPLALFITCSDSRVIPSLITGAGPGDLFELRTAGNIVPAWRPERPTGETATIEFAVEVLGVSDVIVCGHSHCGAVGALVRGQDLTALPALRRWLSDASPPGAFTGVPDDAELAEAVQSHALAQLDRLATYPAIQGRLERREIGLHAWYYQVHTGSVLAYKPAARAFLPL